MFTGQFEIVVVCDPAEVMEYLLKSKLAVFPSKLEWGLRRVKIFAYLLEDVDEHDACLFV
jgi:hypothetical protein